MTKVSHSKPILSLFAERLLLYLMEVSHLKLILPLLAEITALFKEIVSFKVEIVLVNLI